jgi:hypothetical protein
MPVEIGGISRFAQKCRFTETGSASVIGDPFQNSISSPYFFCTICRRSLADFNIAQSATAHFLWVTNWE